ncbi:MAG: acylneuraminate cytidylyltransferase family protein [Bacteroidetes bacterium]|nr:MAG: acylneuraminate cytidylyltransferase family protein [Bacteroidota bacterium]
MRILGVIPARGGSKGIPRKNIKILAGKPLLAYTAEASLGSALLDKVVLSSDDSEIMKLGKKLGLEVPFSRPDHLAQDSTPTLPVVLHALEYYESMGEYFDAVCLLQVTTPFRTVKFIDEAVRKFSAEGSDSLVSVKEVPHQFNPHWTFKVNNSGFLQIATGDQEIISRRQELPKVFHRDGSIYLTKTEVLKNHQSLYGKTISYILSPESSFVNIDSVEDWEQAELLAAQWTLNG